MKYQNGIYEPTENYKKLYQKVTKKFAKLLAQVDFEKNQKQLMYCCQTFAGCLQDIYMMPKEIKTILDKNGEEICLDILKIFWKPFQNFSDNKKQAFIHKWMISKLSIQKKTKYLIFYIIKIANEMKISFCKNTSEELEYVKYIIFDYLLIFF